MRSVTVAIASAIAITSLSVGLAAAKPANLKQAKDAGVQDAKCSTCHAGAKPPTKDTYKEADLTPAGKWLVEQKAAKKAAEVDGTWMKDYSGPK